MSTPQGLAMSQRSDIIVDKENLPGETAPISPHKRILPPLVFILAICLLAICFYDRGYSGLPPTEKRYVAAKTGVDALKRDSKKSQLREPWENLAQEFRSIYDGDPAWPNRPAALFRSAETLEELAKRSCNRSDARKAINCYESLALRHASSRLADDALFRAARLRAASLKDDKGALALLERLKKQYPNGDMIKEARALEKALKAAASGKTAPEALRDAARGGDIAEERPVSAKGNFAGDLPLRYKAARSRMAALRTDSMRACWRQPWEDLREEFLRIHKSGKTRLAPNALYQAAVCQEALATCSRLSADSAKARELYLSVASKYPAHALADDALLKAARIAWAAPRGKEKAKADLGRILSRYPKGDMAPEARRLLSIWDAPALAANDKKEAAPQPKKENRGKKTITPELQVLSWDSPNRNRVDISLELSAPTAYAARLAPAAKGQPARIFIDLENATLVNDVRKGVTVNGSLLKAIRAKYNKGGATLQFDFRDVRDYEARTGDDPCRITLAVAAGKAKLPARKAPASALAARHKKAPATVKASRVSEMASQLGLTVGRVFIDAGHGGKDPGTSHNKVIERQITLDVALSLGRLLEANGLEVVYSRNRDKAVRLSERARMANSSKADLFVSIHVNANARADASGFETYYLDLASNQHAARVAMLENAGSDRRLNDMRGVLADVMLNARVDESRRLAADIQRLSIFRMKKRGYAVRDNGVKSAPFHVLIGAHMPAVLVEVGYCSNPAEAKNLTSPKYRHALAEGLAEGILAYKDRLLRNRTARNGLTGGGAGAM